MTTQTRSKRGDEQRAARFRVGFDIGGTFTDLVVQEEGSGQVWIEKVLTTSDDPVEGVLAGLDELLERVTMGLPDAKQVIHGTTLGSNIVVERRGTKTGLLTTKGFRDVLLIQRQFRASMYNLFLDKVQPLLPRYLIREVTERMTYDGKVVKPLDENSVRAAVGELLGEGVRSFAVTLLHAYASPLHERRVAEIVREECSDALVSLSSDVCPQWREYERTNTTVVNAYIRPVVETYLTRLTARLREIGLTRPLYIMQSNGGISPAEMMGAQPVKMLESGPAAGSVMAAIYGRLAGIRDLISFDMGGTTAKVCLIEDGRPKTTNLFEIDRTNMMAGSGLPVNVPSVDLIEIGSGGGSIASVVRGVVTVGPQSAGASPGPVCYARGGTEPTVTDANLVLGYLNPRNFLGGRMPLDLDGARRSISRSIAEPLGVTVTRAAWGIYETVNANMVRALRMATIERGRDPREFTLIAFGGAGPVHACRLAGAVGIPRVLVPAAAGVTSALGLLASEIRFDLLRTLVRRIGPEVAGPVNALFHEMEEQGRLRLSEAGADGEPVLLHSADMHYAGQGFEITVHLPERDLTDDDMPLLLKAFNDAYRARFGFSDPEQAVEATTWKLTALVPAPSMTLPVFENQTGPAKPKEWRAVYFTELGGDVRAPVFDRHSLRAGHEIKGPAIIEERESTTVIPPDSTAIVDTRGTLIVSIATADGERV